MTEDEHQSRIDPYETLDVSSGATAAEVRVAYLQKVREHPPERDPEGFKRVREAYEVLRSPRKRAELSLLELRGGPQEFDLDRLHDVPPPPVPEQYARHLLAVVLADLDAALEGEAHRAATGVTGSAPRSDSTSSASPAAPTKKAKGGG